VFDDMDVRARNVGVADEDCGCGEGSDAAADEVDLGVGGIMGWMLVRGLALVAVGGVSMVAIHVSIMTIHGLHRLSDRKRR